MTAFAIGVDLGGTNLRIAAVDDTGRLMEKMTTGTQVARGRDHVIDEMSAAIRELAAKFKADTLLGIGIGVPGIIDMETGMLRESPNLPGWHDYPVRDEIEKRLGTRVILENDANSAALGEKWLGAARDHDDMCMLTLGTGVGGGIVLDGRVWHGFKGMAAELGHITVEPNGPACGCGSRGCVEQFASATAVVRMAKEAISSGRAPELARAQSDNPEFGSKIVYQMAIQGDRAAQEIYQKVGWALGIVVADLVNIFNLPIYVIGGGVASAWDAFAPTLLKEVAARSFVYAATTPDAQVPPDRKKTIITRALLSGDAGLYGAARLPMIPDEVREHRSARLRTA
jgi:glucokinase